MSELAIPAGVVTRRCLTGAGVLSELPGCVRGLAAGRPCRLVADTTTWRVAGASASASLAASGIAVLPPIVMPAEPVLSAEAALVEVLRPQLAGTLPVAVGAGTINDLVKLASHQAGCAGYICVATAPSVDGYTASGAAITVDGFKQTLACPAPLAVVADSDILAGAPPPMIAAGYADLAAKIIGGADWLIADAVGSEPLEPVAFNLVQRDLRGWLAEPEKLCCGDRARLQALFTGLAQSGFAMQHYGLSSRPASGCEHLLSHVWEMRGVRAPGGEHPSHGFKVAIGTLVATVLLEWLCALPEAVWQTVPGRPLPTAAGRRQEIAAQFGQTPLAAVVSGQAMRKFLTGEDLIRRRQLILAVWPELRRRLRAQVLPYAEMRALLAAAGAPVSPGALGLDGEAVRAGVLAAGMIRCRYTVLDLLYECGLLDEGLSRLECHGY